MSLVRTITFNIKNKVKSLNFDDGLIPKLFKNRAQKESGHTLGDLMSKIN